ncbi:hypothetical protein Gotur_004444 [Gossypium turneri]
MNKKLKWILNIYQLIF